MLSTGLVPVEATIDSYLATKSPHVSLWLLRRVIHFPVQTTFAEPLLLAAKQQTGCLCSLW